MKKREKRIVFKPSQSLEIYFKDLAKCPPVEDKTTEIANIVLWQRYKDFLEEGKDIPKEAYSARDKVIRANLRFVFDIAKEYQGMGAPLEEIVAVGNEGLFEAIDRFDQTRGFKFISYAVWWIRQKMLEYISENKIIRLPLNRVGEDNKKRQSEFGASEELVASGELDNINAATVVSLQAPINEDGDEQIMLIKDVSLPADALVNDKLQNLKDDFEKILQTLDKRDRFIVTAYYGLDTQKLNLEEIGEELDLTRERVRQLKDKAITKIRSRSKKLFAYL